MAQRKELGSSSRPGKQRRRVLTSAIKPCEHIRNASARNYERSVAPPPPPPSCLCSMISCIITPPLMLLFTQHPPPPTISCYFSCKAPPSLMLHVSLICFYNTDLKSSLSIYIIPLLYPLYTQFSNVNWRRARVPDRKFVKNNTFFPDAALTSSLFGIMSLTTFEACAESSGLFSVKSQ